MKKILLLAGVATLATGSFAQNGFYLSPSVGTGIGNVKMDAIYTNQSENTITQSGVLTYNVKVGIGYKYKNWRFQPGYNISQQAINLTDFFSVHNLILIIPT